MDGGLKSEIPNLLKAVEISADLGLDCPRAGPVDPGPRAGPGPDLKGPQQSTLAGPGPALFLICMIYLANLKTIKCIYIIFTLICLP
jgi:hypothetical protein